LLELGADVNAVDKNGETALHGAAYQSRTKLVTLLVERGADISVWNKENRFGWTPLDIARGHRPGNFRPAPDTIAAVEREMLAKGVALSRRGAILARLGAVRLALKYMTPVILLTDGYLANGAEPWRIPNVEDLPKIDVKFRTDPEGFHPYVRDQQTLARAWAIPGTPGLIHRIGGLEKDYHSGHISYDADNHELMCRTRAAKIAGIANDVPEQTIEVGDESGKLLVVGWGSTYGAIREAVQLTIADSRSFTRQVKNLFTCGALKSFYRNCWRGQFSDKGDFAALYQRAGMNERVPSWTTHTCARCTKAKAPSNM